MRRKVARSARVGEYKSVPDSCTCGATLPEGALFCHKCGKPQRAEILPPEEAEPRPSLVEPALPAAPELPGIGFRNSVAVRAGLMAAALICLFISLPMPVFLSTIWQIGWLVAGGFFSVYLYMRRSGQALTMGSGARMGWITGLFCFLIVMVFFTIGIAGVAANQGLANFFRDLVAQRGAPEMVEQLNRLLETPGSMAAFLGGILVMFFLMLTILPAVGGALGAKVLEKD